MRRSWSWGWEPSMVVLDFDITDRIFYYNRILEVVWKRLWQACYFLLGEVEVLACLLHPMQILQRGWVWNGLNCCQLIKHFLWLPFFCKLSNLLIWHNRSEIANLVNNSTMVGIWEHVQVAEGWNFESLSEVGIESRLSSDNVVKSGWLWKVC